MQHTNTAHIYCKYIMHTYIFIGHQTTAITSSSIQKENTIFSSLFHLTRISRSGIGEGCSSCSNIPRRATTKCTFSPAFRSKTTPKARKQQVNGKKRNTELDYKSASLIFLCEYENNEGLEKERQYTWKEKRAINK